MQKQIKHSKLGEVNTEIRALEIKWFGSNSLLYDNEYHIVTMPLTQDLTSNRKNKKTRTISFLSLLFPFSFTHSLWNGIRLCSQTLHLSHSREFPHSLLGVVCLPASVSCFSQLFYSLSLLFGVEFPPACCNSLLGTRSSSLIRSYS